MNESGKFLGKSPEVDLNVLDLPTGTSLSPRVPLKITPFTSDFVSPTSREATDRPAEVKRIQEVSSTEYSQGHKELKTSYTGITIDRANSTARVLEGEIRENGGRIPFSRFMEVSLFGADGYYSAGKADINGSWGDFITRSSSEPFNQTIGNSLLKVWEKMGCPDKMPVIESGAGTGIMAKDILIWARKTQPKFYDALQYVIIEYGDLRKQQQETIGNEIKTPGRISTPEESARDLEKVRWVQGSAIDLPLQNIEGVFLSNELPDAFPVEVVKEIEGEVRQKYVTLENDQWIEVWDDPSQDVQEHIRDYAITLDEDGAEEPINLNAVKWQKAVDQALTRGAVITIDYGQNGTKDGVPPDFRATRTYPSQNIMPDELDDYERDPSKYIRMGRKIVKKFSEYKAPGYFDITSDINFAVLARAAEQDGLSVAYSGSENDFLVRNGIGDILSVDEFHNTNSLDRLIGLFAQLQMKTGIFEPFKPNDYRAQVLTKGIDIDFVASAKYPTLESFFDTGFKLNIGRPNEKLYLQKGDNSNRLFEITTDADGCVPFFESGIDLVNFFSSGSKYIIRDGPKVILDSSDEVAVKAVVENSGYQYDLPPKTIINRKRDNV